MKNPLRTIKATCRNCGRAYKDWRVLVETCGLCAVCDLEHDWQCVREAVG